MGYSGHKHMKGDKIVAFCDRNCNILAPFVTAPGNRNESVLFKSAIQKLLSTVKTIGIDITGGIMS